VSGWGIPVLSRQAQGGEDVNGHYADIAEGTWQATHEHPFNALASLTAHAVRRGITEHDFLTHAWKAGSAVRGKGRPYGEDMCRKVFRSQTRFLSNGGSPQRANARFVEDFCMWVFRVEGALWRGRAGCSDRIVLDALTARAARAGSITVNASVRLLAEETLLSVMTVQRALNRLGAGGWVRLHASDRGLARMATLRIDGVNVFSALDGLDADHCAPHVPIVGGGTREEVFARRGLKGACSRVYAALDDHATVAGLMEVTGFGRGAVRSALHRLAAVGLASRVDRYHWRVGDRTCGDVAADRALPGAPTAGLRDRMRRGHDAERFRYAAEMAERDTAGVSGKVTSSTCRAGRVVVVLSEPDVEHVCDRGTGEVLESRPVVVDFAEYVRAEMSLFVA